jgi:hypothetical protein
MTEKPGDYILVDNITIEEKKVGAGNSAKASTLPLVKKKSVSVKLNKPVVKLDGRLDDADWEKASVIKGFGDYKSSMPVKGETSARLLADEDNIYLGIKCVEPEMNKLKADIGGSGGIVWKDDVVEIFFDSVNNDRKLSQFVVCAGGGRWMGHGTGMRINQYNAWDAKVFKGKDYWTIEAKIPLSTLGWKTTAKAGESIGFNVCRQRKPVSELSCWAPVRGNFHDKKRFGLLVLGDFQTIVDDKVRVLKKELAELPGDKKKSEIEALLKKISDKREKLDAEEFSRIYAELCSIKMQVKYLKAGNRKFVVAMVAPTADLAIPFEPDAVFNPQSEISVRAAINEFKPLPLAVANMTNKTAAYRIFVYRGMNNGSENPGLKDFPKDRVVIREAVRVKDSDSKNCGLRYDPLPLINQAYTITVPPKQSGLVWITLNCIDVKPGSYKGKIRVIPLSEPAKFVLNRGWKYNGAMQDIPFKLTVLPIQLSKEPAIPLWLMRSAINEKFFKSMINHGDRVFQISPWSFKFKFDDNGNITDYNLPEVEAQIKEHLDWSKKFGIVKGPRFLIGFSACGVFQKVHAKKFKYGTAKWAVAWQNWLRGIETIMNKCGIGYKDYVIEIWDEPHLSHYKQMLDVSRLAKKACPKMQTQVTFGATRHNVESLDKLLPFIDVWCMWGSYFDDQEYLKYCDKLKKHGKKLWFYYCSTNMRESLYRYYRRHAWIGYNYGTEVIGLYTFISGPGGYYGRSSWKCVPEGGVVYRSFDECIPSVRYECLRLGNTDIKYMDKLKELMNTAAKKKTAATLVSQAKKLLKDGPYKVAVSHAHDKNAADEVRNKAIELILKLQEAVK